MKKIITDQLKNFQLMSSSIAIRSGNVSGYMLFLKGITSKEMILIYSLNVKNIYNTSLITF